MSKAKKVLLMCTAYVLVAALAIGGTIAYLQDSDSDVNVMTLGNVSIAQREYQRAEGGSHINSGAKEGDLVPFVQGQPLYPAVPTADDAYEAEQDADKCFHWGVYSPGWNGLWDDSKLANVMDKFVFVENTGKSDAYYRTLIALECPEGMTIGYSGDDEINVNINGNSRFDWDYEVGYITIDGTRYEVWSVTYTEILTPGEVSRPSLLQVVLTHNATNEHMELLGETYDILVLSQAVQAEGFADAKTALDTAFGDDNVENATEWFGGIEKPTYVFNSADFALAMAEGGDINLGCDVEFGGSVVAPTTLSLLDNTLIGKGITVKDDFGMKNGKYVMYNTFDYIDVRPNDESVYTFSGVKFVNEYRRVPNANVGSDRVEAIVKHTASNDAKTTFVFENCEFENAQVHFSGLSGVKGEVEITFKDCTFNAMMGSDPVINIGSNLTGTVNIDHCTFNITGTYANVSVIDVSNSSNTTVTVNATNNTLNANKAVPYTYDPAKGETEADSVKIGNVTSIRNYCMFDFRLLPGGYSTINETGTILQGEVAVPSLHN